MTEPKTNFIPEECKGWKIDGVMYPVLEEAQRAAIKSTIFPACDKDVEHDADYITGAIVANRAEVVAILSLEAPKERKTRRDKGTKRTTKIAPVAPAKP